MKQISENRIECELCHGCGRIFMKLDEEYPEKGYNTEACPLCEAKGYLAIITQENV